MDIREKAVEVPQEQMISLICTLVISTVISVEQQLPALSRYARKVRRVEEALVDLAKLVATPLEQEHVDIGVEAWNQVVMAIESRLTSLGQNSAC